MPAETASAAPAADPAVEAFLAEVRAELARARAKFPGDRIMTLALAEEFGELCKAVLDESAANVRKEAVQTAVMAARVVLDGDGSVTSWRAERGLDRLAGGTSAPAVPAGVTHYGLFRPSVPNSPMIKEAAFFAEEGGLTEPWGQSWEPIRGAASSGEARRMFAQAHGVTLSNIYDGET